MFLKPGAKKLGELRQPRLVCAQLEVVDVHAGQLLGECLLRLGECGYDAPDFGPPGDLEIIAKREEEERRSLPISIHIVCSKAPSTLQRVSTYLHEVRQQHREKKHVLVLLKTK